MKAENLSSTMRDDGNLRRNRSVIVTQAGDEINSQQCKPPSLHSNPF